MAHIMQARGIFSSHNDSNFTCARPKSDDNGEKLSIGITFKTLMEYITLACLGLTTISALFLIWKHLHRYTRPKEQRQIVRIIFLPLFFCIIALLSIHFYQDSIYLKPLIEVYEAFCVAALFLLYVEYVCPDEQSRPKYFNNLDIKDKKGKPIAGLQWFTKIRIQALQFPLTKTLSAIVQIITQAANVYCSNSLSPRYAHLWLILIDVVIIGGAVQAVIRFQRTLKKEMDPNHHALAKLIALKGVVIFQFLQEIIFGLLNDKLFHASATITYNDLYYGIPNMLTGIEALIFSLFFHYAYRSRQYHTDNRPQEKRMGTFRAIFDAMNLSDIAIGVLSAFYLLFTGSRGQNNAGVPQSYSGGVWQANPPKRQRTQQLDDMALEPLADPRFARRSDEYGYHAATHQQQQYPAHMPPSYQQNLAQGYETSQVRDISSKSRDPTPSPEHGSRPLAPRDVV